MSDNIKRASGSTRWSIWLVGFIALVWHGLGVLNLLMQQTPDILAQMPESHRALAEPRPPWVTIAFGVSVFSGVLGSMLLLFRRMSAYAMFMVSLMAAMVATAHGVLIGKALSVFNPAEIVLAVIGPVALGVFLIWYTKSIARKGWLIQGAF